MSKKTLSLQDILTLVNAEKKGKDDFLKVTIDKGFYEVDGLCVGSGFDYDKLIEYVCKVIYKYKKLYILPEVIHLNGMNTGYALKTSLVKHSVS